MIIPRAEKKPTNVQTQRLIKAARIAVSRYLQPARFRGRP
jgi:hypothetical protein